MTLNVKSAVILFITWRYKNEFSEKVMKGPLVIKDNIITINTLTKIIAHFKRYLNSKGGIPGNRRLQEETS